MKRPISSSSVSRCTSSSALPSPELLIMDDHPPPPPPPPPPSSFDHITTTFSPSSTSSNRSDSSKTAAAAVVQRCRQRKRTVFSSAPSQRSPASSTPTTSINTYLLRILSLLLTSSSTPTIPLLQSLKPPTTSLLFLVIQLYLLLFSFTSLPTTHCSANAAAATATAAASSFDQGSGGPSSSSSSSSNNQAQQSSSRVVKTKYGALRGFTINNFPNKALPPVEAFLGIPYASPPVGRLRFMPPVTPPTWTTTRSATTFGPVCPQRLADISNETEALGRMTRGRLKLLRRLYPLLANQSEDCLYLNIYTVASATRELARLPVLMFIHGESYEWNAGSTVDGSVLASASGLVVVTINYRLGILGFFPSPGGSARGNFGLMDQVAALHWIQENIREFGGDERNVTVMGHGTGAACVNFLMLSPMARGLFHRAIMASGSALSPWAIASDAVLHGQTVARAVGCQSNAQSAASASASGSSSNSEPAASAHLHASSLSSSSSSAAAVLECLRERSVEELTSVPLTVPAHLTAFGPIIDGIVLPGDPAALMSRGGGVGGSSGGSGSKSSSSSSSSSAASAYFSTYALLFGVTRVERPPSTASVVDLFNAADERHGVEVGRRDRLLRTLVRNLYSYHLQEIFYTLVNEYTDWTRPFLHPISLLDSLVDIFSDALVVAPAISVGLLHSSRGGGNSGSNGGVGGGGGHGGGSHHQVAHHAQAGTYFYAFGHQTESGDYSPRLGGAVSGQELAYLFGAPLINGYQLSAAFPLNYTRAEVALSEAFIRLVANFVRTGDPNNNQSVESNSYLAVNKGSYPGAVISEENFFWPPYEEVQQKYASFGTKVTTGDHYLAHRLSYWFNLLPQLHKPGSGAEHHLLDSHNNPLSYEGVVRSGDLSAPIAFDTYFSAEGAGGLMGQLLEASSNTLGGGGSSSSAGDGSQHHHQATSSTFNQSRKLGGASNSSSSSSSSSSGRPGGKHSASSQDLKNRGGLGDSSSGGGGEGNASFSMIVQSGNYSAALSLIIAIGVSLLVLNLLVFAGILYKKGKNRLETKLESKKSMSLLTTSKQANGGTSLSAAAAAGGVENHNNNGGFKGLAVNNNNNSCNANNSSSNHSSSSVQMYRINSITDDYHNQRSSVLK